MNTQLSARVGTVWIPSLERFSYLCSSVWSEMGVKSRPGEGFGSISVVTVVLFMLKPLSVEFNEATPRRSRSSERLCFRLFFFLKILFNLYTWMLERSMDYILKVFRSFKYLFLISKKQPPSIYLGTVSKFSKWQRGTVWGWGQTGL